MIAEVSAGQWDRPDTWEDVVKLYAKYRADQGDREVSRVAVKTKISAVAATFPDRDPLALSASDAITHRDRRLDAGMSPATVRSEITTWRAVQRWMVGHGWLRVVTWQDVPMPRGERGKRVLTLDQIGIWIREAERMGPLHYAWARWPAVAWLLLHGLRVGEIHALDLEDLDLRAGAVRLRDRLGRRLKTESSARTVWLCDRAAEVLREVYRGIEVKPDAPAVPYHSGGRRALTDNWIRLAVYRTCERAGLPQVCPHSLRHGLASLADLSGVPLSAIQRGLGHANPQTTLRYLSGAVPRPAMDPAREALDRAWRSDPGLRVVGQNIGAQTVNVDGGEQ